MMFLRARFLISFCLAFLLASANWASADKRVALVIGNGAYKFTPQLTNPTRDARDMTAAFRTLGFKVYLHEDLDRRGMQRAIREFVDAMDGAEISAFFFAGHAVQVRGRNYLLPTDTPPLTIDYLNTIKRLRLDRIMTLLEENTKTRLLFIDACRDNPLGRSLKRRTGSRTTSLPEGLARISRDQIATGTLISFATSPGKVAADGRGKNSPYTAVLKNAILTPNADLGLILRGVRRDVRQATFNAQIPWFEMGLEGLLVLNPKGSRPIPAPPVATVTEKDRAKASLKEPAKPSAGSLIAMALSRLSLFRGTNVCNPESEADSKNCIAPGPTIALRDARADGEPCPECPQLAVIPRGTFIPADVSGAGARFTKRRIQNPVLIGRHEVSFAEWDACVAAGDCNGYRPSDNGWGRGAQPVINVSFADAERYVRWLSKHTGQSYALPTEALWSYAARAGTKSPWWWGEKASHEQANFDASAGATDRSERRRKFRRRTVAVDQFAANPWGLLNVHGNVAEWTASCWTKSVDPSLTGTQSVEHAKRTDGDCAARSVRGGGWDSFPEATVAGSRQRLNVDQRRDSVGFRVLRIVR